MEALLLPFLLASAEVIDTSSTFFQIPGVAAAIVTAVVTLIVGVLTYRRGRAADQQKQEARQLDTVLGSWQSLSQQHAAEIARLVEQLERVRADREDIRTQAEKLQDELIATRRALRRMEKELAKISEAYRNRSEERGNPLDTGDLDWREGNIFFDPKDYRDRGK